MEHTVACTIALSELLGALQQEGASRSDLRSRLSNCARALRHHAVRLERAEGWLLVDGTPHTRLGLDLTALIDRLDAHHIRRLVIKQYAPAAEILKLASLLVETGELPPESRLLWHVDIYLRTAEVESQQPATSQVSDLLGAAGDGSSPEFGSVINQLVELAEKAGEAGDAACIRDVLMGLHALERRVRNASAKQAVGAAATRLATPSLVRQVAQLLPTAGAQRDDVLKILVRTREEGARALIAHLMAAETLDQRRVFFDAIVDLRAGVPQLIDALGHPEWFVVRNAAALLGEMGAREADSAIVPLLQHEDERVRKAAATALSKLDTPAAITALRQLLDDKSPDVRQHAASAFSSSVAAASSKPLSAALDTEWDGDVQLAIVAALGRLGTPDAVQKLIKAIHSPDQPGRPMDVRIAAAEALVKARGPAAINIIRPLLQHADHGVRSTVKGLIGKVAI